MRILSSDLNLKIFGKSLLKSEPNIKSVGSIYRLITYQVTRPNIVAAHRIKFPIAPINTRRTGFGRVCSRKIITMCRTIPEVVIAHIVANITSIICRAIGITGLLVGFAGSAGWTCSDGLTAVCGYKSESCQQYS